MMDETQARALLSRPIPPGIAAELLCVPPDTFTAAARGATLTLGTAWTLARRYHESALHKARAARRGRYMAARRAAERAARSLIEPADLAAVLAALGAAVAAILDGLAVAIAGTSARLSDRLDGARRAVAGAAARPRGARR